MSSPKDHRARFTPPSSSWLNLGECFCSIITRHSLGHSTVVFVLALLLNFGIRALDDQVKNDSSGLHNVTGIIGTGVSGSPSCT